MSEPRPIDDRRHELTHATQPFSIGDTITVVAMHEGAVLTETVTLRTDREDDATT